MDDFSLNDAKTNENDVIVIGDESPVKCATDDDIAKLDAKYRSPEKKSTKSLDFNATPNANTSYANAVQKLNAFHSSPMKTDASKFKLVS